MGFNVTHVMNITDVEDKIIRDSVSSGKGLKEFTEFYTQEFYKDRDALSIISADTYAKATSYIKKMLELIQKLIDKGHAYQTSDGSVYFSIKKDADYGKLSHITLSDLKENADGRIKSDEYDKENAQDFALWKAWDQTDGEVAWDPHEIIGSSSTIARGRPGWHIECSAMSMANLGESIDIHTGGVDLIFPHHENEIAQSECATGKPFVKYWIHNEHLLVDGAKMSKSLGNFYTLRDLTEKGISPLAFRYWLYTGHYRTKVNFTLEAVAGSATALARLYEAYLELGETTGVISTTHADLFKKYMDDDLNTAQAVALVWDLLKDISVSPADKKATLLNFDNVFGFGLETIKKDFVPEDIQALAKEREEARRSKDWAKSDVLRDKIKDLGYEVKDTEDGPEISKI
jgi:cysteinyl-tRNA synthetase